MEQMLAFIEDYRSHSALWDITDKNYKKRMKRNDAYTALAKKYGMTEKDVQKKIKSLRSYFLKEYQKVKEKKSGTGAEYVSTWIAYRSMLFILDSVTSRITKDSITHEQSSETFEDNSNVDTENPGTTQENNEDFQSENSENDSSTGNRGPIQSARSSEDEHNFTCPVIRTKRNVKKARDEDDKKEEDVLHFLKLASTELTKKDDCTIFGQMIASQIRKLNQRNQAIAKNCIQNYLFELEMEEINSVSTNQNSTFQAPDGAPSFSSL